MPFDCDPCGGTYPHAGSDASASKEAPSRSKRYTPKVASTKPTIVVGVTLEKFLGLDPDAAAEVIGCGPIADSVLAEYILDANIVGMIFGQAGQPLWMPCRTAPRFGPAPHVSSAHRVKALSITHFWSTADAPGTRVTANVLLTSGARQTNQTDPALGI
jgi:hypothetical protein